MNPEPGPVSDSILLSEIHAQPAVLSRLLAAESAHIAQIAARLRARDIRYIIIAARGTSDNAARYAQYLFGAYNQLPVALAAPSLFTQYHAPPRMEGALVIGVSQSGASPDLIAVVAEAKRQGCPTLAITNVADSPLVAVAAETILLHAYPEQSIAATKTYTAQLLTLALLSTALNDELVRREQLLHVPQWIERALAKRPDPFARPVGSDVTAAAEQLKAVTHCVVIGRGFNYATAFEVALKIKELAYIAAEPYSAADFLHGPIALIEQGATVIVVNPSGAVSDEVLELLSELVARGAQPVVISDQAASLALAAAPIALPPHIPEWLSPLVAIVPGQLLAYQLSLARGFDPDHPRGLQKVTRTV